MNTYRKDNTPTTYGFACGYCMTQPILNGFKQMYKKHNTFHVKTYIADNNSHWPFKLGYWYSYEKLVDARKSFIKIKSV